MTFTPDSDTLITVGDDKNIRFWDSKPSEDSQESDNPPKHSIITKVTSNLTSKIGIQLIERFNLNGI